MQQPTPEQIEAAITSAKSQIPPIYRHLVSDAEITSFVTKIAIAIVNALPAQTKGA
jgi:hypothetical protein